MVPLSKNIPRKGPRGTADPSASLLMTQGGGSRNNPTQAKRRLEWATQSFVASVESPVSVLPQLAAGKLVARDDKGEGDASMESGCRTEGVFHHLGWVAGPGRRPMIPPVGMTIFCKMRAIDFKMNCHPSMSYFASSASRACKSAGSSGVVLGAKRAVTLPSRATTNFSKFQRISGSGLV
jgi:hypothetical protein